ncbi:MAG: hypothetical protein KUG77_20715 [Nannocystaceae bacterium]|nr:hypothetical protein [Nannocystaceae bacterium]
MSGVAIVSVAAVYAGYLWFERHQVRRFARVRTLQRRQRGVLRWCEPAFILADPASQLLERHIEDAVRCADFAWSYHRRLFQRGAGESPFQLRRTRVDAAQRRFARASERLERQATAWLASAESETGPDEQSRLAVVRMHTLLCEHPASKRYPVGDDHMVAATVDVLENALANLRQRRTRGVADPFRGVADGVAGQDVTPRSTDVPQRHVGGSRDTVRR